MAPAPQHPRLRCTGLARRWPRERRSQLDERGDGAGEPARAAGRLRRCDRARPLRLLPFRCGPCNRRCSTTLLRALPPPRPTRGARTRSPLPGANPVQSDRGAFVTPGTASHSRSSGTSVVSGNTAQPPPQTRTSHTVQRHAPWRARDPRRPCSLGHQSGLATVHGTPQGPLRCKEPRHQVRPRGGREQHREPAPGSRTRILRPRVDAGLAEARDRTAARTTGVQGTGSKPGHGLSAPVTAAARRTCRYHMAAVTPRTGADSYGLTDAGRRGTRRLHPDLARLPRRRGPLPDPVAPNASPAQAP